jgi:hypothetical protein
MLGRTGSKGQFHLVETVREELLVTHRNSTGAYFQKEPNSSTATQSQQQTRLKQSANGWPAGLRFRACSRGRKCRSLNAAVTI